MDVVQRPDPNIYLWMSGFLHKRSRTYWYLKRYYKYVHNLNSLNHIKIKQEYIKGFAGHKKRRSVFYKIKAYYNKMSNTLQLCVNRMTADINHLYYLPNELWEIIVTDVINANTYEKMHKWVAMSEHFYKYIHTPIHKKKDFERVRASIVNKRK